MRIGDKVATFVFWLAVFLLVGPLILGGFVSQFDAFQPWLLVAAVFALIVTGFGVRQCWQLLRGLANEPEDASKRAR